MDEVLSRPACGFKHPCHHVLRRVGDQCTCGFEARDLVRRGEAADGGKRAGVPHSAAFWCVAADDKGDDPVGMHRPDDPGPRKPEKAASGNGKPWYQGMFSR